MPHGTAQYLELSRLSTFRLQDISVIRYLRFPTMQAFLGRGKRLQAGVTICCLMAFILFGYEQGVFGGILENQDWLDQFNHPSDTETGIIVSCYNLGCLGGCICRACLLPLQFCGAIPDNHSELFHG